jgi:hypothetical protein
MKSLTQLLKYAILLILTIKINMAETFSSSEISGTDPATGLYHVDHMPMAEDPSLAALRGKQLAGEPLTMDEQMRAGRDTVVRDIDEPVGHTIETYHTKPDHVYRAVGYDTLRLYNQTGSVIGFGPEDEMTPGTNRGVDWYLGGTARKYGEVILEAPADPEYFEPAAQQGQALAKDPKVRHMKSSGHANPVPFDMVKVVQG